MADVAVIKPVGLMVIGAGTELKAGSGVPSGLLGSPLDWTPTVETVYVTEFVIGTFLPLW
jgi:hypothetical protein